MHGTGTSCWPHPETDGRIPRPNCRLGRLGVHPQKLQTRTCALQPRPRVWNAESARIVDFAIDFVIGFVIDFVMKIDLGIDFGIDFLAKIDFGIDF